MKITKLFQFKSAALLLLTSLFSTPVGATIYTVKASGGNFTTVTACSGTAVAGDTCQIFAGNYAETPSLTKSGTPSNPITFSVNPGDCVTIRGFNLGNVSYVTIGLPNAAHCTNGSLAYSGFEITAGQLTWSQINNVIIQNNYIHATVGGSSCLQGPSTTSQGASTFVYVLNNVLTNCGGSASGGGIQIEGNHWLIDGNTISHVQDGMYLYGAFMVVRRNHFGPITAVEQGANHPDAVESSCTSGSDYPLQHMLFESNTIQDWRSPDGHGLLLRDTQSCGMTDNVMRFNQFINVGSYWTSNETNSRGQLWYNNSSNNTEADFAPKEMSNLTFTQSDTGGNVINNSFANDWSGTPYCIYVDGSATAGFIENHNACFLLGFSGSWQSAVGGYSVTDIFNQDPKYVNVNSDLRTQAGSPLIGKGGPLTTTTNAGVNSISLVVTNAKFFSDGYGLTGVQADWIRIGTMAVQITSVNYATNTLTLASPATWATGMSVYLYKNSTGDVILNGTTPDIGAFQTGMTTVPRPPTNLQIQVQ